jgi:hypothetical protein
LWISDVYCAALSPRLSTFDVLSSGWRFPIIISFVQCPYAIAAYTPTLVRPDLKLAWRLRSSSSWPSQIRTLSPTGLGLYSRVYSSTKIIFFQWFIFHQCRLFANSFLLAFWLFLQNGFFHGLICLKWASCKILSTVGWPSGCLLL